VGSNPTPAARSLSPILERAPERAGVHGLRACDTHRDVGVTSIRPCRDDERTAILAIVNAAAEAYRGVIPEDRWHEPYMASDELDREIAAGVAFWGYEADGTLVGVMGMQPAGDVDLIRHAYVAPGNQGRGIGGALLAHLRALSERRMLVGTWAAADWAIRFYRRHGFEQVSATRKTELLQAHWDIPERQIETSVVLAQPAF
jgi:GNAT superfamily N-acetyltransferase